MFVAHIQHS